MVVMIPDDSSTTEQRQIKLLTDIRRYLLILLVLIGGVYLLVEPTINEALDKVERVVVILEEAKEGLAPVGKEAVNKAVDSIQQVDPETVKEGMGEVGTSLKEGMKSFIDRRLNNGE